MIKQPERNYRLTDEEYDYVNFTFDNLAKRGDDDAAWICAKLYKQHTFNPSDVPQSLQEIKLKQTLVIKTPDNK